MSEVTFAKSFLTTIDKKPIKLPADHVSDPRKYPNQSPSILPKSSHPFPKKVTSTQPAQAKTITATLKPMRAGETVALPDITLDSTVYDVKTQYASKTGLQPDRIKLLLNKKPAQDLKTLKDIGIDQDVEFSVMIMGGASGTTPRAQSPVVTEKAPAPPAPVPAPAADPDKMDIDENGPAPGSEKAAVEAGMQDSTEDSATAMLKTDEFWSDLQGFLSQRLRDESEGEKLSNLFKEAWTKR